MNVVREEERKRVAKGTVRYGNMTYEVRSCRAAPIESCDGIENWFISRHCFAAVPLLLRAPPFVPSSGLPSLCHPTTSFPLPLRNDGVVTRSNEEHRPCKGHWVPCER
ncbi:unnamed protein product [Chondrus crispus]|uniref:Uncharacterized protein n=1 Tax=Chondrus crispus TaxID=2769 RepID=R7Q5G8_CHOCR|nr:unnamed protein product [Chondrus crispus]CDF33073.1 unnamed protein product [Chondrus crispus]|eukprot:XP_005712876.1 unnamed protein product [Chondrus crispus]